MLEPTALCDLFGLTSREAAIAMLLADGHGLEEIARRLRMAIGTARNHLKSVFEKTDTTRQAELVALLGRLRP
jgi:DNA-binding CsgD family transcriptional regulator